MTIKNENIQHFYYIYEHWLHGKLFYIGKGTRDRAFNFKNRSVMWLRFVNGKEDTVHVVVKGYFKKEDDAFEYERYLIRKESFNPESVLTNYVYNLNQTGEHSLLYGLGKDAGPKGNFNSLYKNDFITLKSKRKIDFYHNGKVCHDLIDNKNDKILIFVRRDELESNYLIRRLVGKEGVESLLHKSKSYRPAVNPIIKHKNLLIYPIEYIRNFPVKLSDEKIKVVVVDTVRPSVYRMIERLVDTEVDVVYIKQKASNTETIVEAIKYTDIIKKNLNVGLSANKRKKMAEELNVRRTQDGRVMLWPTIERALREYGYHIQKKRTRVSGGQKTFVTLSLKDN